MPKLKKLDVQGFKSFADPLVFEFPTGVTAIVGPNGSGKSNLADAIRWVLGEQRMTTIRGHTGEDMIFAGSGRRARSGMARASIAFDNSEGWLPVDFAEVIVERRTYRDGRSEYRLNGSRIRLRDLRDVLDKSGLGRDAYLIVGQGLVDQVLSLKPQDRLTLFEQAAGISPYRTRREDAINRLADTQRNLERVYDIVGEIEPSLRRLKRQKARAEQHSELTRDLNDTLKIWYGYRWGKALVQLEQAKLRVAYREDRVTHFMEHAGSLASELLEHRKRVNSLRNRLAELHRDSSVWLSEASNRQRELAVARERQHQIQERLVETQANLDPLLSAQIIEVDDVKELSEKLVSAEQRLDAALEVFGEAEAIQKKLDAERHAVIKDQTHLRALALENRHRLADRQSRIEQADLRLEQLDNQFSELQAALDSANERRLEKQTQVENTRRQLEEKADDLDSIRTQITQLGQTKTKLDQEVAVIESKLNDNRVTLTQHTARLDALNQLAAEGTGLYAGVRTALQAAERNELEGLSGTVSSVIQVPSDLELAIETALGSSAQNIISSRWADAQNAISWLKEHNGGRATFLPLDTLRVPRPLVVAKRNGVIGAAADLVKYDPRYRPAILLLLGRTAVAQNLDAARRLFNDLHGSFRIVTLDGEILRSGGAVTGGRQGNSHTSGLLARERQRREIPNLIAKLKSRTDEANQKLHDLKDKISVIDRDLDLLRQQEQTTDTEQRMFDRQLEQAVSDLDALFREVEWQKQHVQDLEVERGQIIERKTKLDDDRIQASAAITEKEKEITLYESKLSALSNDEIMSSVVEKRTSVALIQQEVENYSVLLQSRQREAERMHNQVMHHQKRAENLTQEREILSHKLENLQTAYDEARSKTDDMTAQVAPFDRALNEAEATLEDLEKTETEARRVLREAEQQLNHVELESNRREDRVQNLRHEIEETLGIVIGNLPELVSIQQPLPLETLVTPLPSIHELPENLEHDLRDLRTQIRRLEPVNMAASQEYDELFERHSFLRTQMMDLEKASGHLRSVIAELDAMMDVLFRTTFKSIAIEFTNIFKILFDGGNATLQLIQGNGTPEGVEITARPPGKRTAGLGMLSGGERTLTAVALLFSVMQVSPAPFCVLDEVDAMLDEANVGRFRRMLRGLANQTQFIIITHNRGTVEVADTIYGVSMQDDGVSQVLSLSIADLPTTES